MASRGPFTNHRLRAARVCKSSVDLRPVTSFPPPKGKPRAKNQKNCITELSSTVDQNLALQRDALTEAGCTKIFNEQMSGAVTDRPALHDALEFARSGDTLIVWKLDRLARSMKQLIETVETLRMRGIGFRSLTEALDTTTAQRRLVFHMFGALAEFERSLIRERTQAGLAAARRAGRTGGRPPKLTDDDIEAAEAMLANPDIASPKIAHASRLTGDAVSVHPGRAHRKSAQRIKSTSEFCYRNRAAAQAFRA